MPETPDFDQMAQRLFVRIDAEVREPQKVAEISEALRLVWNAALDAVDAKAEECLGVGDEWTKSDIESVVKRLRR